MTPGPPPKPLPAAPGLLRWAPVEGADGYQVWFVDIKGHNIHRYDPASGAWSVAEVLDSSGPVQVTRYNMFPTASINGLPLPGTWLISRMPAIEASAGAVPVPT